MISPERRLELAREKLLLKRKPQLCVMGKKGAVVRAGIELDSTELMTLKTGEIVIVAEERFLGSKVRARITKPVCGWVSRKVIGVNEDIEHENDVQVVVATDKSYVPLLDLWMEFYEPIAVKRTGIVLHVLCLDETAPRGAGLF